MEHAYIRPSGNNAWKIFLTLSVIVLLLLSVIVFTLKNSPQSVNTVSNDMVSNKPSVPLQPLFCPVSAKGNPLILEVITTSNGIVGEYRGVIKAVTYDSQKLPQGLTLTSLDGGKIEDFDITSIRAKLYSLTVLRPVPLSTLVPGMQVDIGFSCRANAKDNITLTTLGVKYPIQ